MDTRRPALREVLYPRRFNAHPRRSEVTRTINRFDTDEFKRAEDGLDGGRSADGSSGQAAACRSCLARGAA